MDTANSAEFESKYQWIWTQLTLKKRDNKNQTAEVLRKQVYNKIYNEQWQTGGSTPILTTHGSRYRIQTPWNGNRFWFQPGSKVEHASDCRGWWLHLWDFKKIKVVSQLGNIGQIFSFNLGINKDVRRGLQKGCWVWRVLPSSMGSTVSILKKLYACSGGGGIDLLLNNSVFDKLKKSAACWGARMIEEGADCRIFFGEAMPSIFIFGDFFVWGQPRGSTGQAEGVPGVGKDAFLPTKGNTWEGGGGGKNGVENIGLVGGGALVSMECGCVGDLKKSNEHWGAM